MNINKNNRVFTANEILMALDRVWKLGYEHIKVGTIKEDAEGRSELAGRGCALAGFASALGLRDSYVNYVAAPNKMAGK